jgi:two-component system phosphate regulon sensor histidine kinase PhoR
MRHTLGLRSRLFLTTIPLVLAATAALTLYLLTVARDLYLEGIENQLVGQARLVASATGPRWDDRAAVAALAGEMGGAVGKRVTIIAADGTVLGDSSVAPALLENHASRPEVRAALAGDDGLDTRRSTSIDDELIYAAAPIVRDGQIIGVARVAQPIDRINAQLAQLRLFAVVGVCLSLALAAGLSALLARYILQPIIGLTELADRMAAGRLDSRIAPRSNDELGRLGLAFNRMAGELGDTIALISDERTRLAVLLETMGDGLLMIDHDGVIVLANSAAEQMLDPATRFAARPVGRTEVRGRPLVEVARDHELIGLVRDARRDGEVRSALIESGGRRTIRAVAAPVGGVAGGPVLLVLHDLTEVRRLETARRDFVANISHELRTPLASVRALVETLEGGAIEDDATARHFLALMREEVDHLTEMVRELLELSRIESGQVPLRLAPVEPSELIERAVARLGPQAERAGHTLTITQTSDQLPVLADSERIGQVLLNLLHNAIKFTPPGGHIIVAAERSGDAIVFSVRDSGIGIDPGDLPRVFERFYKADKARSGGGTGLGLAIAKHLVGAHGGTLAVRNNTGAPGATFSFTLPVAAAREPVAVS